VINRHLPTVSLVLLGLSLLAVSASAQEVQDFLHVSYFSNNGVAGAPDATVRLDNPGTLANEIFPLNLCAMIYVFDNDQQLTECCGCLVTPDGLRTLSVSHDLTSNPLTGVVSNNGVIKVLSAEVNNEPCDPTSNVGPVAEVRGWASHIQNKVGAAYPITETPLTLATLSEQEVEFNLVEQCSFAQRLGSGHAICTCGTGD